MRSTTRRWELVLDRTILGCAAFILLIQLIGVLNALGSAGPGAEAYVLMVAASVVVLLGACAVALAGTRPEQVAPLAALAGALGVAAAAAATHSGDVPEFAELLLPANTIQALQIAALVFVVHPSRAVALVLLTGPAFVAMRWIAGDRDVLVSIDLWVLPAASSIALVVAFSVLRAGAVRAGTLADEARAAARRAAALAEADAAVDEARRLVHDDVITALRCIELDLERDAVARACRSALDALDAGSSGPTARTTGELVGSLARAAPVTVEPVVREWSLVPPARVVAAFEGAASEALRNVARHAGVDRAEVRASTVRSRCVLEVRDEGGGFAPGAGPGFGVSTSVVGRMTEVGGAAEIDTGPRGTVVRLSWPGLPDPDADHAHASPLRFDRLRTYLLVGAAPVLANTYLAARFPGMMPLLGWAVALSVGGLLAATALLLSRRPARPLEVVGLGAVVSVLVAGGLTLADDGALLSAESWVVGYGAVVLALVAFEARWWAGLVAMALEVGTVVVSAALDPSLAPLEPVGALVTPVVVVGLATVLGTGLRRGRAAIELTETVLAAQDEDRAWRSGRAAAREVHLEHLRTDVVPFLEAVVAEGGDATVVGSDPAQTARVLGELCRDDLHLARPLPAGTRAVVRRARERGVTVSIRAAGHRFTFPDQVWSALEEVLASTAAGHVVTVLPPHRVGDPVRIVAVPPVPAGTGGGQRVSRDRFRTTIRLSAEPPTGAADHLGVR